MPRKSKKHADDSHFKRYEPTVGQFLDLTEIPEDGMCSFVFDKKPEGSKSRRCQYDVKLGSPFCSQCVLMVEKANASRA